jgi:hypothetical protein
MPRRLRVVSFCLKGPAGREDHEKPPAARHEPTWPTQGPAASTPHLHPPADDSAGALARRLGGCRISCGCLSGKETSQTEAGWKKSDSKDAHTKSCRSIARRLLFFYHSLFNCIYLMVET